MGREGKGIGRHTLVRCSSPAKPPSLNEQRAAQLALLSPLGKEDRGREKEQRREGAAAPAGLEGERGGLEGAARADSVESGGWGSKGRRWNIGQSIVCLSGNRSFGDRIQTAYMMTQPQTFTYLNSFFGKFYVFKLYQHTPM